MNLSRASLAPTGRWCFCRCEACPRCFCDLHSPVYVAPPTVSV
ncbi:hypothetical protein C4K04_4587 [Pseudomonas chlororaphis]|uniref:Uncharacterized protein n=1 Tax=Pseudomonas chlororaphis TaxID=587753 RepID=A0A3G7TVD6_9PSED|nr:hypothetical protein C4K04_4587 [Pseudomonas chlororaphis]